MNGPPVTLTASLPGADGAPVSQELGFYEAPTLAEITVSGLLSYSGMELGYYPGSGVLDYQGRWLPGIGRCASQVTVRIAGVGPVGGGFGSCPGFWESQGTITTYAVVSGELVVDRGSPAPGACFYGGSPCASISGEQTVVVTPLDGDLLITANPAVTTAGGIISAKFTPTPDALHGKGMPYSLREVRFEGSGPVLGGGQTTGCTSWSRPNECTFRLYQSGFLVVEGVVSGRLKVTRKWLTMVGGDSVPPPPPPDSMPPDSTTDSTSTDTLPGGGGGGGGDCAAAFAHGLTLAACDTTHPPTPSFMCTPGSVVRALLVSCKVTLNPAVDFTLDSIRSQSGTTSVGGPSNTSIAAGNTFDWTGTAVASSRVSAWITFDSSGTQVHRSLTDSFTVQARSWSELDSLWPAPLVFRNTVDSGGRVQTSPVPTRTGYSMILGVHLAPNPVFALGDIGQVGTGPNAGLYFLTKQISFQRSPLIYTTPAFVRGAVFNDQNGGRGAHLPRCTQGQWSGAYQAEAERHEGATQATNSHWGIYRTQFGVRKLNQEFEGLVSDQGNPYFLLTEIALRYSDWLQNTLVPLQVGLDVQDIGTVIPQTVGCEPDLDPTDG